MFFNIGNYNNETRKRKEQMKLIYSGIGNLNSGNTIVHIYSNLNTYIKKLNEPAQDSAHFIDKEGVNISI